MPILNAVVMPQCNMRPFKDLRSFETVETFCTH